MVRIDLTHWSGNVERWCRGDVSSRRVIHQLTVSFRTVVLHLSPWSNLQIDACNVRDKAAACECLCGWHVFQLRVLLYYFKTCRKCCQTQPTVALEKRRCGAAHHCSLPPGVTPWIQQLLWSEAWWKVLIINRQWKQKHSYWTVNDANQ